MAVNPKNSDFITRARQAAAQVLMALSVLDGIRLEYDSLFNATLTDDDFVGQEPVVKADIIAEMTTQAALDSVMDSGNRTNLLKVK